MIFDIIKSGKTGNRIGIKIFPLSFCTQKVIIYGNPLEILFAMLEKTYILPKKAIVTTMNITVSRFIYRSFSHSVKNTQSPIV
jgi:hypothetical protein